MLTLLRQYPGYLQNNHADDSLYLCYIHIHIHVYIDILTSALCILVRSYARKDYKQLVLVERIKFFFLRFQDNKFFFFDELLCGNL